MKLELLDQPCDVEFVWQVPNKIEHTHLIATFSDACSEVDYLITSMSCIFPKGVIQHAQKGLNP